MSIVNFNHIICIPVKAGNTGGILSLLDKIRPIKKKIGGEKLLCEIWLDLLGNDEIEEVIKYAPVPCIVVCKAEPERGFFRGSEKERVKKICRGIAAGAAYADVGLETEASLIVKVKSETDRRRSKLIISKHFWNSTPPLSALKDVESKARARGADIVKIATYVSKFSDNSVLFEFTANKEHKKASVITIGMGEKGRFSRMGCRILGSFLTFAALDENHKTADGQPTVAEVLQWH